MRPRLPSPRALFLSGALCAVLGAGLALQCRHEVRQERAEAAQRLDALALQQSRTIANWLEDARIDLRAAAAFKRPGPEQAAVFRATISRSGWLWIQRVDRSGRRLMGAFREGAPEARIDAASVAQARISPHGAVFFRREGAQGRPYMDIALPDGGGALFLRMDPGVELFRIVHSAHAFSATAESVIFRRMGADVQFLFYLHGKGSGLRLPVSTANLAAAKHLRGEKFDGTEVDYAGRRVLAVARPVAGTDWILLAKVDDAEITAPIVHRYLLYALLLALGLGGFLAFHLRRETLHADAEFAAGREIAEKTHLLDAFFRFSAEPIILLDRDFNVVRVNEVFAKVCGGRAGDFAGRSFFEFHKRAASVELFRQAALSKTPSHAAAVPCEISGHPDREPTFWDWTLVPLLDAAGEADSFVLLLFDAGARVRAEAELKRHAAELDDLYNNAPCGYHSLAEDGTYLRVNDTELAWLGYRREELVGVRKLSDLMTAAGVAGYDVEFPAFKERGWARDVEFDMVRKDGSLLPVVLNATAVKDERGRYVMCRSMITDNTDRKRAEEARARLAALVEGSDDAIIGMTIEGTITTWNEGAHRLYGWTAAEALGENAAMLVSEGETEGFRGILGKVRRGEHVSQFETNRRRMDGRVIRVSLTVSPVKDRGGAIVGASAVARDVTQRCEAERAVVRLTRSMRTLSLCNEALVRAKSESELLERVCRLIVEQGGYRLAWVGLRVDDAAKSVKPVAQAGYEEGYLEGLKITWADEERGRGPTGTAIRDGTVEICRDFQSDPRMGPWREEALKRGYRASIALPLRSNGRILGALMIYAAEPDAFTGEEIALLRELSEDLSYGIGALREKASRELSEAARHRTEIRYRRLFESAHDGIVIVDSESEKILDVNPALLMLFGCTEGDCVGRLLWDFEPFKAAGAANPNLRAQAARGQARHEDMIMRAKDGREIPVELTITLYTVDGGVVLQYTVRDMSESRRLQAQILHGQKMASVGLLAGGIAHDLNNILMVILGNASFLLSSLGATDPRRADVEEIQRAEERAAALTRQLLIFSRKQPLHPVVLELNELIRNLQKMLGRIIGEDVKLELELCPEPVPVRADAAQLEQVIMNLSVNARDAMPSGGRLCFRTSRPKPGEKRHPDCAAGDAGQFARLEVSDTGTGMTPEIVAHVFEPFFTTKPAGKGTGLGLSTVYGVVRQAGGGISVSSVPGKGTAFTIDLPLSAVEAAAAAAPEPASALPRGRETILLVEDDDLLRRIDQRLLQERGYRVIPARDGEEALVLLHNGGKDADLLLTDVVMPGISGGELAREARRLKPGLRVLFVSGYVDHRELEQLMTAKSEFLQKPVAPEALARKVREVLDRPAPAAAV